MVFVVVYLTYQTNKILTIKTKKNENDYQSNQ